jgi:hypothetical protein
MFTARPKPEFRPIFSPPADGLRDVNPLAPPISPQLAEFTREINFATVSGLPLPICHTGIVNVIERAAGRTEHRPGRPNPDQRQIPRQI